MTSIKIPAHEHRIVRVFALSLTDKDAEALRRNAPEPGQEDAPTPLQQALGSTAVNPDFVEVFPVAQIAELGLDGYLEQGNGIDPADLDLDRPRLRALEGWVLIVYSSAFGGIDQTLSLAPELTLIGTYGEPGTDWSATRTLQSDAAKGTTAPARKKPSDAAMSGRIAMLALLVLFFVTFMMVWIGG